MNINAEGLPTIITEVPDDHINNSFDHSVMQQTSQSLQEPEWAFARRQEAWNLFQSTPLPTRSDEGWRRTDVSGLNLSEMEPPALTALRRPLSQDNQVREQLNSMLTKSDNAAGRLIEVDGQPFEEMVSDELIKQGVIVTDLGTAIRRYESLIRDHFDRTPYEITDRKFTSLAQTFWTGGKFIYVPDNVEVKLPIEMHSSILSGNAVFPRLLVIVGKNSKVALLDEFVSPDAKHQSLSSATTEIFLGEGADVRYVLLNRWGENVYHFHHQRTVLGKDAHLKTLTIGLGSHLTKATIEAFLNAQGSSSDMLGLVFGTGNQHFDHHTVQFHKVGQTLSDLLFKTALDDKAHSVYSGLIRIEKDAQRSNAYQANRNLLLSKDTQADSIPNLEIHANDVRCSHGATVAPIDPEYIFYLMSRGIPEVDAKRLVVEGWFEQVLDRADIPALRELVSEQIAAKIRKQVGG